MLALVGSGPFTGHVEGSPTESNIMLNFFCQHKWVQSHFNPAAKAQPEYWLTFTLGWKSSWTLRCRRAFLIILVTLFGPYLSHRWERYEGTNEKKWQDLFLRQFALELRYIKLQLLFITLEKCNTDWIQKENSINTSLGVKERTHLWPLMLDSTVIISAELGRITVG